MATTKTTEEKFNGTGSKKLFPFTIEYLDTSDLQVFVSGVKQTETTDYSISGSNLVFLSAPDTGTNNIRITRSTLVDSARALYAAGSSVRATDLNNNQDQTLFKLQELEQAAPLSTTSATAPTNPNEGDVWYDTTSGRTYVYFSSAESSQWVEANPPSAAKDIVSVKDFGVTGDGVTDDAAAINSALTSNAGKTIFFPAGTYLIGAELLPKASTTIYGDGIENTIIKASSSLATNITLINIVDGEDAVTIRDLRVDGNESSRSSGSGGSNNIMIMSNRNILERVSTIEAENAGILFGSTSDASEENTVNNCIIEDNNGVGLSQSNCSGTIITNNKFARNGLENLTIDANSNRTICTNNRFFKHFGGVGNIGWDDSIDSKICDNFIDNQSDTTATAANRNGICIANQIAGTDPTTHRCMISNNHIVNFKNNGIWLKDTDDSGAVEDAGAFIISNNFVARADSPEAGSTDIKIGKTTFKIIIEGNNAEDIDVDDATLTNMWGFSSDVQVGSTKHTVIDKFTDTDKTNDRIEPSVFVSATYDGGDLTGDPSAPLGIYAQHELKGSTSTNAYTHSIMGYGLNNSAGDNDAIGTSGRARKKDVTNGIGDAAGVWGSAYQESTKDGGVMAVEGSIYQNVAGTSAADRLGAKWSTSLHLNSDSTGSKAISGIAIDSTGNGSGKHGYWNGIIIDGNSFGSGSASTGATGTVGLNFGSWSDSVGFPEHGIKFGKVKYGISFGDVATNGYHLYKASGDIKTFGNYDVTGNIGASGNVSVSGFFSSTGGLTTNGDVVIGNDTAKLKLGLSDDLQIYHDGSNSTIQDSGTGALNLNASLVQIHNADTTELLAKFIPNGAVQLYYDGALKAETRSDGFEIKQHLTMGDSDEIRLGNSADLKIYHASNVDKIESNGAGMHIRQINNGDVHIHAGADSSASNNRLVARSAGAAELYYSGTKKLETTSAGATIHGDASTGTIVNGRFNLRDTSSSSNRISWQPSSSILKFNNNYKAAFGDSSAFQIYHNGTNNYLDTSAGHIYLRVNSTENGIKITQNGNVEISYDGSKKLETSSGGVTVTGTTTSNYLTLSAVNPSITFTDTNDNPDFKLESNSGQFKIIDTTNSADRLIVQSSGAIDVQSNLTAVSSSSVPALTAKGDGSSQDGYIQLNCSQNSHGVKIKAPPHSAAASYTLTLPDTDGSANQVLKTDGNGNLDWVNQSSGGGGSSIGGDTGVDFNDSVKARFGNSNDLEIYHSGSHSFIKDSGTGNLQMWTNQLSLLNSGGTESMIQAVENAQVELYYDNSKKLNTESWGVDITGTLRADTLKLSDSHKLQLGTSNDLEIYHDGTNSYLVNGASGGILYLQAYGENSLKAHPNGQVELFYDASKKLETTSSGVTVTGDLTTTGNFGTASVNITDISPSLIFTDSAANSDYRIRVQNGVLKLRDDTNSADRLTIASDGQVNIGGAQFYQSNNVAIPVDGAEFKLGAGDDLKLYHDGTHSYIDNATGIFHIRNNTGTYNGNTIKIQPLSGEDGIVCNPNGAVSLYNDNSKKLETTSGGVTVSGNVFVTGNFRGDDNSKLDLGSSNDLQIYHDGSHSRIVDTGTGDLKIQTNNLQLLNAAGNEYFINGTENGAVELYYDNSKKLATTSVGVDVTGNINLTAELNLTGGSDAQRFVDAAVGSSALTFRGCTGGDANHQEMARFFRGGACELNHSGNKKLETTSSGVTVTGGTTVNSSDNAFLVLNAGGTSGSQTAGNQIDYIDFKIADTVKGNIAVREDNGQMEINSAGTVTGGVQLHFAGSSDAKLQTLASGCSISGNLNLSSELNLVGGSDAARFIDSQVGDGNGLHFRRVTGGDAGHENMAIFIGGGSCQLYHDNNKKIETTSSGVTVTGSVTTNDINMSNLSATANEVDNTKGSWTIQEGSDDLFLINRVNGKKYKFNITEVS